MRRPASRGLIPILLATSLAVACWNQGPTTFDAGRSTSVETEVIRSKAGAPIANVVHVRLNGNQDAWMLLDSGAEVSILDAGVGSTLALRTIGRAGAGSCSLPITIARGNLLEAGAAVTRAPVFALIDLKATGLLEDLVVPEGIEIHGVLGAPLFSVAVVQLEYSAEPGGEDRVSVFDPERFTLKRGEWTPVRIREGRPLIEASLEGGRRAWFHLDTGKTETASLFSRYWTAENLLAGKSTRRSINRRLCGEDVELRSTLDWFELGGRRFDAPEVAFKPAGSLGDKPIAEEAGNLGQGFLRAFTVVLDLPHERIALLSPNMATPPEH